MIYLDSAATTLQKPPEVAYAMKRALAECGGAGRGGHEAARVAAQTLYNCREAAAEMFHMSDPARVVLTSNATHALNIAIKGLALPGKKVVISGFEHNAVYRPLMSLEKYGVKTQVLNTPLFEPEMALHQFEEAMTGDVGLVVCIHVSNVFGYILPVERIAEKCRECGVPMIVDAAQSAGHLPIDGDLYPLWCMPGHKGLHGPQGTGLMLLPPGLDMPPLIEGGTGGNSRAPHMPDFLPDRLEAGTHNAPGAAGLTQGIRFASRHTRGLKDKTLLKYAVDGLSSIRGVRVFYADRLFCQTGVVSFTVEGMDCETVASRLAKADIAVRAGLHCAPLAHISAGTEQDGTVRASFSAYSTERDVYYLIHAVKKL